MRGIRLPEAKCEPQHEELDDISSSERGADMILEEELVVVQQKKIKADRDADRKRKFRSGRAVKVQE
jgi:hypothetical protein